MYLKTIPWFFLVEKSCLYLCKLTKLYNLNILNIDDQKRIFKVLMTKK